MEPTTTSGGVNPAADKLIVDLDAEVQPLGWRALFHHTGGGHFAILVHVPDAVPCERCGYYPHEILITDDGGQLPFTHGGSGAVYPLMVGLRLHTEYGDGSCGPDDDGIIRDDEFRTRQRLASAAIATVLDAIQNIRDGRHLA